MLLRIKKNYVIVDNKFYVCKKYTLSYNSKKILDCALGLLDPMYNTKKIPLRTIPQYESKTQVISIYNKDG